MPKGKTLQYDGCEVHPRCLECPLPQCRYDNPKWFYQWKLTQARKPIINRLQDLDVPLEVIAAEFGVSVRQLFKIRRKEDYGKNITKRP